MRLILNFMNNYKLTVLVFSFIVPILLCLNIVSSNKETIKEQEYIISNLEDNINNLENELKNKEDRISELEVDKEELENRVSELEYTENKNIDYSSIYQNGYDRASIFNETEINENEIFNALGSAIVVYRQSGCDYMILQNTMGYILAEWMGGNDPMKGDNIAGNFNSFGTKEFYNNSMKSKTKLWIGNYMLSKERALEKVNEKCN